MIPLFMIRTLPKTDGLPPLYWSGGTTWSDRQTDGVVFPRREGASSTMYILGRYGEVPADTASLELTMIEVANRRDAA